MKPIELICCLALTLALTLACATALAQDKGMPAAEGDGEVIKVAASRDPEWKPYRKMVKILDVFEDKKELAPNASLRFWLKPQSDMVSLVGATIRIAGDHTSLAVPIAADGTFAIPRDQKALDDDADFVLSLKKDSVRPWPSVHTPGLPANVRRLGDLRMECELVWYMIQDEIPFWIRLPLKLVIGNACTHPKVNFGYALPPTMTQKIETATMVSGERREGVKFRPDGRHYTVSLGDRSWNDETLIEFTWVTAADGKSADGKAAEVKPADGKTAD